MSIEFAAHHPDGRKRFRLLIEPKFLPFVAELSPSTPCIISVQRALCVYDAFHLARERSDSQKQLLPGNTGIFACLDCDNEGLDAGWTFAASRRLFWGLKAENVTLLSPAINCLCLPWYTDSTTGEKSGLCWQANQCVFERAQAHANYDHFKTKRRCPHDEKRTKTHQPQLTFSNLLQGVPISLSKHKMPKEACPAWNNWIGLNGLPSLYLLLASGKRRFLQLRCWLLHTRRKVPWETLKRKL